MACRPHRWGIYDGRGVAKAVKAQMTQIESLAISELFDYEDGVVHLDSLTAVLRVHHSVSPGVIYSCFCLHAIQQSNGIGVAGSPASTLAPAHSPRPESVPRRLPRDPPPPEHPVLPVAPPRPWRRSPVTWVARLAAPLLAR